MAEHDPKNDRVGTFAVGLHVLGATPIDPDEAADLIPATVRTLRGSARKWRCGCR